MHPNTAYYINELARTLNISPGSVYSSVKRLESESLLTKEELGKAHYYRLNKEHLIVGSLKKAYGIGFILSANVMDVFLENDPGIISLALYGSFASGNYDENSDIDFLIITS